MSVAGSFVIILPLPLIFIAIGVAVLNGFTVKRNSFIGYRTRRSMRCVRSWGWAQSMLGEYLLTDGVVMITACPLLLAVMMLLLGDTQLKGSLGEIILLLQVLTLLPVILKIESNLKKEQNRWEIK